MLQSFFELEHALCRQPGSFSSRLRAEMHSLFSRLRCPIKPFFFRNKMIIFMSPYALSVNLSTRSLTALSVLNSEKKREDLYWVGKWQNGPDH